jgi:hypothetical protein
MKKIFFLDGPPGSGKSTSAELLATRIRESGHATQVFFETQLDHPLHVVPPDEFGAAWPDIHLKLSPAQFAAESLFLWSKFLGEAGEEAFVLESFPFQSTLRVLMQMNAGESLIQEFWMDWQAMAAAEDSVLIYFREPDHRGLTQKAMDLRGDEWTRYMVGGIEQMPYVQARGWKGVEAVHGILGDYAILVEKLMADCSLRTLIYEARPTSYEARQLRIYGDLGLS